MRTGTIRSEHTVQNAIAAWVALIASPLAFFVSLHAGYSMVPYKCGSAGPLFVHMISLSCLALSLGGGWLGYHEWRRSEEVPLDDQISAQSAVVGALACFLCGLFSLVIIGQWFAGLIFNPCF